MHIAGHGLRFQYGEWSENHTTCESSCKTRDILEA